MSPAPTQSLRRGTVDDAARQAMEPTQVKRVQFRYCVLSIAGNSPIGLVGANNCDSVQYAFYPCAVDDAPIRQGDMNCIAGCADTVVPSGVRQRFGCYQFERIYAEVT